MKWPQQLYNFPLCLPLYAFWKDWRLVLCTCPKQSESTNSFRNCSANDHSLKEHLTEIQLLGRKLSVWMKLTFSPGTTGWVGPVVRRSPFPNSHSDQSANPFRVPACCIFITLRRDWAWAQLSVVMGRVRRWVEAPRATPGYSQRGCGSTFWSTSSLASSINWNDQQKTIQHLTKLQTIKNIKFLPIFGMFLIRSEILN